MNASMLNLKWSDFVPNNTIRDQTHQEFVSNVVRKRRWNYLSHVLRSDEKRLNRQVLMWTPGWGGGEENVEDLKPPNETQFLKKEQQCVVIPYKNYIY